MFWDIYLNQQEILVLKVITFLNFIFKLYYKLVLDIIDII